MILHRGCQNARRSKLLGVGWQKILLEEADRCISRALPPSHFGWALYCDRCIYLAHTFLIRYIIAFLVGVGGGGALLGGRRLPISNTGDQRDPNAAQTGEDAGGAIEL